MKCIMGDVLVAYAVADPGEGPATPSPLSFRPNWGPKARKNFFWRLPPTPPPNLKVWIYHWYVDKLCKTLPPF